MAWQDLLRGLVDRGLRLVISDDHEGIKAAVATELPGAAWQRCVVHFARTVLAHVPERAEQVVVVFPNERGLVVLTTVVGLQVSEE